MSSRSETNRPDPRPSDRTPPHISPFRWLLWWVALFFSLILFYGVFGIFWFGLRAAAWIAEFRPRRYRARAADRQR